MSASPLLNKINISEKNQLKVIHNCPVWLPLTQIWLYNQIRYLPDNIENHIVCQKVLNLEQFYLPNIHSFSGISKWQFSIDKILKKLKLHDYLEFRVKVAKREKAILLHSHFGYVGWGNLTVAQKAGLIHVVTFYGIDVNGLPQKDPIWGKRYQKLFEAADLFLCEGSHMAQCIVDLGCPKNKVRVHHLGVSIDEIEFKPRVWTPQTPLKIIICASFTEKKGIPYALEALGQLQHKIPLEITIIGDANPKSFGDRQEKQRIIETISKYNLNSKVRLLGYQPHDVFLKEAERNHIFISPSVTASDGDTEGGAPVSIIEMAASGMPIVSTAHCDIPEIVLDGVTGFLAEERDVSGLLSILNRLIDYPDWNQMLISGRKHVESEYNAEIQADKLAELYQKVVLAN